MPPANSHTADGVGTTAVEAAFTQFASVISGSQVPDDRRFVPAAKFPLPGLNKAFPVAES